MSTVNSSSSQAAVTNTVNGIQRELQNLQTVQVFKDDSGTRRVLLGKGKDGFYGVKVSQEGNDVYDAADENLVFNSDNNLFKIVQTGVFELPNATVTKAGTNQYGTTSESVSVPHGLSFVPGIIAYVFINDTHVPLPWTDMLGVGSNSFTQVTWRLAVDDTNIFGITSLFTYNATVSSGAFSVKYYLLRETASV